MKALSGYMGCLTIKAMSALKHLATYLKGTIDHGVTLHRCDPGDVLMDHLSRFCQIDSESLSSPSPRAASELEVFSDSNWAGCNFKRKAQLHCISVEI